ncbi:cobaltochelatase CobT-related protein [Endozoicomonas sp. ALC066]|uniref:vWA domain-containing protein n=1 Tax=Endozoicomonas sp. ALC066 TaxID=3403078 RepID=UPI003BB4C4D4
MHIFRALPIVAASYGDNFGVSVVVNGTQAQTNGETIQIPELDINADKSLADVLWGYLSHEASHIKFTDFHNIDRSMSPIERHVWNTIEDVWIENALIDELPGTRYTMDKTLDYVVGLDESTDSDEQTPAQVLTGYLWNFLRYVYREQKSLQGELERARKQFDNTFPKALCRDLETMIRQRMPSVNSTEKAVILAKDIIDSVKQHIPPEEPEQPDQPQPQQQSGNSQSDQGGSGNDQQSGDGQKSDKTQNSDTNASGKGDEKKGDSGSDQSQADNQQPSDNSSGDKSQSKTDKNDSSANQSGDGQQSGNPDQTQSSDESGAGDRTKGLACKDALSAGDKDLGSDFGDKLKEILNANANQNSEQALPEMSYDKELMPIGNVSEIQDGVLHASKLRAKLTGLVQAQQQRRNYETSQGRHINSRRIDRLCSGDLRIFSHESQRKAVNADVCLLLDSSGSMSKNGRDRICNSTTASLALALSDIKGTDVCVGTFPGMDRCVSPVNLLGTPVRKDLGRFSIPPSGGTPLTQALLWATKELGRGKRDKKIVIVLTDGQPGNGSMVLKIVGEMEASGIHLIGVGIQEAAVTRYFKNHVVINDLNDLGPKLFEVARGVI